MELVNRVGYGIKFETTMTEKLKNIFNGEDKLYMPDGLPWMRMIDRTRLSATEDDAIVLEWRDSSGNPGLLTTELMMPTLSKWAQAKRDGKLGEVFPAWKRFFRINHQFIQAVEDITLKWGVINGVLVDDPDLDRDRQGECSSCFRE
jgi:hypothetical protein